MMLRTDESFSEHFSTIPPLSLPRLTEPVCGVWKAKHKDIKYLFLLFFGSLSTFVSSEYTTFRCRFGVFVCTTSSLSGSVQTL